MPEVYPLPAHAVSMWIAGDDLFIAFPGQGPEERGHTVRLPASVAGLQTTIAIMRERSTAKSLRLGHRGTPTQYELEQDKRYGAILEAMAADTAEKRDAKRRAEAELAELGL
jgi:hypothetical protein